MGVRVAVAGASGYAGGELLRIIAATRIWNSGPLPQPRVPGRR